MQITNQFKKQWGRLKAHMAEVAEIQQAESAKRDKEMEALVAYQDSFRAAKRERAMERDKALQQDVKANNARLDKSNEAKRQGIIKTVNKIAKNITDYLSGIGSQPKPKSWPQNYDSLNNLSGDGKIFVIDTGIDHHLPLTKNMWH